MQMKKAQRSKVQLKELEERCVKQKGRYPRSHHVTDYRQRVAEKEPMRAEAPVKAEASVKAEAPVKTETQVEHRPHSLPRHLHVSVSIALFVFRH